MSEYPIKSSSQSYNKDPFFLIQKNDREQRYVVYLNDQVKIQSLLFDFINENGPELQLKIRDHDDADHPIDYIGALHQNELIEILVKHNDVVIHNGYHDLMIRNPISGDYLVFDEHGLLFIYSDQDLKETLSQLGAMYNPKEQLIYEFNHWHYCLPDGREKLAMLIEDLRLIEE